MFGIYLGGQRIKEYYEDINKARKVVIELLKEDMKRGLALYNYEIREEDERVGVMDWANKSVKED